MDLIKNILKHNRFVYILYYYIFSSALRCLGLFIKTDDTLVLMASYGGAKYDDSPRFLYEYMNKRDEYCRYKVVWAFNNPELYPEIKEKVRMNSFLYFCTALRAKYWITNSSLARGLNFRKKTSINVLFTHGMTGIKKIGMDIQKKEGTYRQLFKEDFDYIFIEGREEIEILKQAWGYAEEKFFATGLPRNDDLSIVTDEEIAIIKKKLNLPMDKKVILYAPTFREESTDSKKNNVLGIPFDFKKWELAVGEEYVLLITAHYEVGKLLSQLPKNSFVHNAFKYPVLNDLLKVSDILITDYSSIVFDYSILERPVFCYGYDYYEYLLNRGTYNDLNTIYSHGVITTEDKLIEAIRKIDYSKECKYTKLFIKDRFICSYGDAAEKSAKIIFG